MTENLRPYRVHLRGASVAIVRVLAADPDDAKIVAVEMFGGEATEVGSSPLPLS